jgi:hypothetical protein
MQETGQFLHEFFTCPICMELIKNPVTTECGHNYCLDCLNKNQLRCAICRRTSHKPAINFGLKNAMDNWTIRSKEGTSVLNKTHFATSSKNMKSLHTLRYSETRSKSEIKPSPATERPNKYRIKRLFSEMIAFSKKEEENLQTSQAMDFKNLIKSEEATINLLDEMMRNWQGGFHQTNSNENYNISNVSNFSDSSPTPVVNNLHDVQDYTLNNYSDGRVLFPEFHVNPVSYVHHSNNGVITKRLKKF